MILLPYGPPPGSRTGVGPASAALIALLGVAACASHRGADAAGPSGPPSPELDGGASLAGGPAALAAGSPSPPDAPGALLPLDDAGLAALLANPGPEPVVVNFWATWCGPCVRELEDLRAVAAERPDVRFALVNVESPRHQGLVARFLSERGGGLPAFQLDTDDPSGMLARNVPAWPDIIPVTLVVDPGGVIRARFDGALDAAALRAALPGGVAN